MKIVRLRLVTRALTGLLIVSHVFVSRCLAQESEQIVVPRVALELVDEVDVASLDRGVVEQVAVKPGDQVSRGDLLLQLDRQLYEAEAEASELSLLIAKQEYRNDVNLRFSQKSASVNEKQLQKSLNAVREFANSISETELDRLRLELEQSKLSIEQAELQREIAQLTVGLREQQLRSAALQLNRRAIASPIDGIVIRVDVQQGESVTAGEPVVQVISLKKLRVKTVLEAKYASRVSKETVAYFELDSDRSKRVIATVTFVNPVILSQEQVFEVWLEIDNSETELRPGFRGRLLVEI